MAVFPFVSGIIIASGGTVSNCLAHPSVRTAQHDKVAIEIKECLKSDTPHRLGATHC